MIADPQMIMVVDDDAELVRGTMLRLRTAGYEATAAYDGGAARVADHSSPRCDFARRAHAAH